MYSHDDKPDELQRRPKINAVSQLKEEHSKDKRAATFSIVDNREEGANSATLQKMAKGVVQRAEPEDTAAVIQMYFPDSYRHYGKALIERVCTDKNMRVHAHGSGKPGDGINAATQKEMDDLLPFLRTAKQAAPRAAAPAKKQAVDKSKRHTADEAKAAVAGKDKSKQDQKAKKHAAWLANQ